jgi:hypothetical protein
VEGRRKAFGRVDSGAFGAQKVRKWAEDRIQKQEARRTERKEIAHEEGPSKHYKASAVRRKLDLHSCTIRPSTQQAEQA